jgi:hypothetical protein
MSLHTNLHPVEAQALGLAHRFLIGPAIVGNSVTGDHGTCSILSFFAMHEDRIFRIQQGHDSGDLCRVRRNNSVHRNVYVVHAGGFNGLCFGFRGVFTILAFSAQIDHRLHSQLCELRDRCDRLPETGA